MPRFSVLIDRDTLRFSASHWIKYRPTVVDVTPDGGITVRREDDVIIEPLHEHTFRAKLEISGPLDEFGCVIDFVFVERILVSILQQFDHKILIPAQDPDVTLRQNGSQMVIRVFDRKWVFPATKVKFLPAKSASTESIATIILAEFVSVMQKNNILPQPFSDDQFVLTLEEQRGMYARVGARG